MSQNDTGPAKYTKLNDIMSAGFRPFFLLAGLYGVVPLLAWLWAYLGNGSTPGQFAPAHWHGHEMIFGFVVAAATGFLLTAVPNWTNSGPFNGKPLALLSLIWLSGRLAMWFGWSIGPLFVAIIDLAMVPALGIYIGRRLVAHKVRQNYMVLVILFILFCANLMMHLESMGVFPDTSGLGINLGIYAVTFLIAMISGRVIPGFTANSLRRRGINVDTATPGKVTALVVVSLLLAILSDLFGGDSEAARKIAGIFAGFAATALSIRMVRWKTKMVLEDPIMWIMHAGHFWLIVGFALLAAANLSDGLERDAGLHALTAGAIGTMIMAMMTRVALGHTGREIKASPAIIVAYCMVIGGALLRVVAALAQVELPGNSYSYLIGAAGLLWVAAYAVYVAAFWPILSRSR